MDTAFLNNELTVPVPDGFHVIDDAELKDLPFTHGAPGWAISDPEKHIIISASWKQSGFAAIMINSKELAKKIESQLCKLMVPYDYKLLTFLTEDLGGKTANGFLYSYTARDIGMLGETLSAKRGKNFYYIHCYMRDERKEESRRILEEFFRAFRWS